MARRARPWYRAARGMWYGRVSDKQVPLHVTDPIDEAAAWAVFNQLIERARVGGDAPGGPTSPPRPRPGELTVAEAVDGYLEFKRGKVKPITVRNYSRHLAHFKRLHGDLPVRVLTPDAIVDAARALGWSDDTTTNYLATVEQCCRWGGKIVHCPKPGRHSAGPDSVIPEPVYRACLRETTGDFHQFIRFLWNTGCRPSEAAKMTFADVDLAGGFARLKDHKTRRQTGRDRLIYFSPEAVEVVTEQVRKYPDDPAGLVFRGMRGRMFGTQAIVMRMVRLSGVVGHGVTAYSFRHTFATRALSMGVPDTHVAALLGQASTAMLHKNYSHVVQNSRLLREAAAMVEGKRAGEAA